MSIQKAYNEWSQTYDTDRNLTRDLDRQVMLEMLANRHFNSILEIGCGTGKNTSFLAQIGAHVHALDFSEGMIEKAREKVKAGNVRFSVADLTQKWPCESQSYDLIVCNLVLEHIEDLLFIFSEAFELWMQEENFLSMSFIPSGSMKAKRPSLITAKA